MFITGDAHQRIYRYRVSLGQYGMDIRGRGKKVKLNYRTTEEIRSFAVRLVEGKCIDDLDSGVDDQAGFLSPILNRSDVADGRIISAHLKAVPLFSIQRIEDVTALMDQVIAAGKALGVPNS